MRLGRLDGGQGLPTLTAALADDRARIAIYAFRRVVADLPANRVIAELRNGRFGKVTVAKETVRLIGELAALANWKWMIALARQNLHRDVRIAVLRGLWDHLEHPETWNILEDAALTPMDSPERRCAHPRRSLVENSRRRLIGLLAGLASHPDAVIRLAVLQRFIDLPLPDSEGRLLQAALTSRAPHRPTNASRPPRSSPQMQHLMTPRPLLLLWQSWAPNAGRYMIS